LKSCTSLIGRAESLRNKKGSSPRGSECKRQGIFINSYAAGHWTANDIERIVFLDAAPKVDVALIPKIGANVQQQLEGDLKDEEDAVRQYNSAINVCAKAGDNGSGELFQTMLKDEEGHADFLDAQLLQTRSNESNDCKPSQSHG
jgi:ferritin-like protein